MLVRFARPFLCAAAAAALLLGAPVRGASAAPSVTEVAVNPFVPRQMPQPPFDPAAYRPYIGRGSGRITAYLSARLKNGKRVAAVQRFSAIVYPYTPYTAWLVARFARIADGADGFVLTEPGSEDVPVHVPDYLLGTVYGREFEDPTLRAARRADTCTSSGVCEFSNLQPGKYLVYGLAYELTATSSQHDTSTYTYDPADDRYEQHTTTTTRYHDAPLNGVVLILHGHLNVTAGGHTYASPPDIQPAAYFNLRS